MQACFLLGQVPSPSVWFAMPTGVTDPRDGAVEDWESDTTIDILEEDMLEDTEEEVADTEIDDSSSEEDFGPLDPDEPEEEQDPDVEEEPEQEEDPVDEDEPDEEEEPTLMEPEDEEEPMCAFCAEDLVHGGFECDRCQRYFCGRCIDGWHGRIFCLPCLDFEMDDFATLSEETYTLGTSPTASLYGDDLVELPQLEDEEESEYEPVEEDDADEDYQRAWKQPRIE